MNDEGVWRTIRGKRIFIKYGEDLVSAMKRSGKFKENKNLPMRETLKKAQKDLEKQEERVKLEQEYAKREYWKAQQEAVNSWKERNIEYDQRNTIIDLKAQYKSEQQRYADYMFDVACRKAEKMTTKELKDYLTNNK